MKEISAGSVSDDLMQGAGKIAEFLFGSEKMARKVYHLEDKGELPTFRLGSTICARKSTIIAWIEVACPLESGPP